MRRRYWGMGLRIRQTGATDLEDKAVGPDEGDEVRPRQRMQNKIPGILVHHAFFPIVHVYHA
jgi:hypothetical protein